LGCEIAISLPSEILIIALPICSFVKRTDPDRDYAFYDLTKDADHVLTGTHRRARQSFSRVKHYPPDTRLGEMKERKRELEKRVLRSRSIFNSTANLDLGSRSLHKSKIKGKSSKLPPVLLGVVEDSETGTSGE
jgi:hypothetical protein